MRVGFPTDLDDEGELPVPLDITGSVLVIIPTRRILQACREEFEFLQANFEMTLMDVFKEALHFAQVQNYGDAVAYASSLLRGRIDLHDLAPTTGRIHQVIDRLSTIVGELQAIFHSYHPHPVSRITVDRLIGEDGLAFRVS